MSQKDERVEAWCEVMHDAYENAAVGAGWETNPASRVAWADVPEANKATMRAAVGAVFALHETEARADQEAAWDAGYRRGHRTAEWEFGAATNMPDQRNPYSDTDKER